MLTLDITTQHLPLDLLEYIIKKKYFNTTNTLLQQSKYPIVPELHLPFPTLFMIVMHYHKL